MEDLVTTGRTTCQWLQATKEKTGILYSIAFNNDQLFTVRSLDLERDLTAVHRWVNAAEAIPYWQMNGSVEMLMTVYRDILSFGYANSFIGLLNGVPICQLDAYDPHFDIVGKYYQAEGGDLGIHLLLGARCNNIRNLSAKIVSAFLKWFFEDSDITRIVAEPDKQNRAANWLLRRLQFEYLGNLELPEKTASFYAMRKEMFRGVYL